MLSVFLAVATCWHVAAKRPTLSDSLTEAFVIGDLHADFGCAKAWVEKSGLVDLHASPWAWLGGEHRGLVFLGDYVDKGFQGREVMEFVRNLTVAFPKNVVALLGNHDLYLLLDALHEEGASSLMGVPVRHYSSAFTHPEEYLNWIPEYNGSGDDAARPKEKEIEWLLSSLFQALDRVYSHQAERGIFIDYSSSQRRIQDLLKVVPPFRQDPARAGVMRLRLKEWQRHFYQGLIDTKLAHWLADRPLVARAGGAILMHGGLPVKLLRALQKESPGKPLYKSLEKSTTSVFRNFWKGRIWGPGGTIGPLEGLDHDSPIHELVTYRGLHKSCAEVAEVLELLNATGKGPELIVVGHTPGLDVRLLCDGSFAAVDSSLSRPFREYGNLLCPIRTRSPWMAPAAQAKRKRDCGRPFSKECKGQTGRLSVVDGRWQLTPVPMFVPSEQERAVPLSSAEGSGSQDIPQAHGRTWLPGMIWVAALVGGLLFALMHVTGAESGESGPDSSEHQALDSDADERKAD